MGRLSRFWLEMSGDDDESVVAGLWWVGLLLSAGAQVSGVVGNQFMKRAHRQNESRSEGNKIPQYKQPAWILGIALIAFFNTLLHLASYAFAAQSLLASIGALTLVWNLGIAWFFEGEKPEPYDYAGTVISVIGVTISSVFGPHGTQDYNVHELLELYTRTVFLITICCGAALFGTLLFISKQPELPLSRIASAGNDDFEHPFAYVIILGAIFFAYTQIKLLNRALRAYDPLIIVPMYGAFMLASRAVMGVTYFEEYKQIDDGARVYLFPIGLVITLSALILFDHHQDPAKEEEEKSNSTSDTEEATATRWSYSSSSSRSSSSSSSSSSATATATATATNSSAYSDDPTPPPPPPSTGKAKAKAKAKAKDKAKGDKKSKKSRSTAPSSSFQDSYV